MDRIKRIPPDVVGLVSTAGILVGLRSPWPYWVALGGILAWRMWLHRPVRDA